MQYYYGQAGQSLFHSGWVTAMKLDVERGLTRHLGWGIAALGLGLMQIGLQGVRAVQAQILPNDPLNPEAAQVNAIAPGQTLIGGGALRGANLFHSFQDFNVGTGEVVLFANPGGIARIFSKVTGGNPSRIDGQFGVLDLATGNLSNADLFLLNPRGILLGPNAQSLVLGSLFLTTAEQVKFGNYDFSAANSDLPPLLTIGVPIGLQMGASPGPMVQESANLGAGLSVAPGRSLTLLGGDITLSGNAFGNLAGGRLELGAVGPENVVALLPVDRGYELDYTQVKGFQDIRLLQTVIPDPGAVNGLEAAFQGRTITFEEAEFATAAIGDQPGGAIQIRATEAVKLIGSAIPSLLITDVLPGATGRGGDIAIEAPIIAVENGGQIGVLTQGQGDAGDITLKSLGSVTLNGTTTASEASPSAIFSSVESGATGRGGRVWIETPRLVLENGGQIGSSTLSTSNAGNITVRAEQIEIMRISASEISSGIFSQVLPGAEGDGGSVDLVADRIRLLAGGQISTVTLGLGKAGDIRVQTQQFGADDQFNASNFPSAVFSTVTPGALGDGGNVQIEADDIRLKGGAQVASSTRGQGNTGQLEINGTRIDLQGTAASGPFPTGFFVTAEPGASGNGDALRITTDSLRLTEGAAIQTNTFGPGQAATLEIQARERIVLQGRNPQNGLSSAISSSTDTELPEALGFAPTSGGKGGRLNLQTPLLRLEDGAVITSKSRSEAPGGSLEFNVNRLELLGGAQIQASAFNRGDSGTIAITAAEAITIAGQDPTFAEQLARFRNPLSNSPESAESAIAARSFGSGTARQIQLQTPQLRIQDGGLVTVSSQSSAAGNLDITAQQVLLDRGFLQANTQSGEQGSINLRGVDVLTLRRGGAITANAAATSTGGNLDIVAGLILAIPNENSDITANAVQGQGGRVSIQTQGLFGIERRDRPTPQSDITASSEIGLNGTVQIDQLAADPSQGLTELPTGLLDEVQQITNACDGLRKVPQDRLAQSRFIRTGRGGLPPDPRQTLWPNQTLSDWRGQSQAPVPPPSPHQSQHLPQRPPAPATRMESQGIRVDADGTVHLVNHPDGWIKFVQNSSKTCQ